MYIRITCVILGVYGTPTQAAEFGPNELSVLYTPVLQHALRESDTNANAELDVIGRFRLSPGDSGAWGETHLSFWALGNHTLGGTLSSSAFSRNAGLLWDSNDGDAPDPDWLLGVFSLQQEFRSGAVSGTVEFGKIYPGLTLATLPNAGDDRDSFMSQIISSDAAGRWYDRIGLGASVVIEHGPWFGGFLVSDATAQNRGFDFDTIRDGSNLVSLEMGVAPTLAGRATKLSLMPYVIGAPDDFSRERGLVITGLHDLTASGSMSVFGRYTLRTGGEPRNNGAAEDARPLKRGGFIGVAIDRLFGRDNQQLAFAVMHGSASDTAVADGFGDQKGLEGYWKIEFGAAAEFTAGLQIIDRGTRGPEYIPGLRLKLAF